jgi:hypothetical protein
VNHPAELPDTWKKPEVTVPEPVTLPTFDPGDPIDLFAWFGPFGFFDFFRKARLSSCRMILRARHALNGVKPTEGLLDDESHSDPLYLALLEEGLAGRKAYEREAAKRGLGS